MEKRRPDPRPLRFAFGVAGVAAASAMATGILSPARTPAPVTAETVSIPAATPAVVHVTRYIHLAPGETAPPHAAVQSPAPAPPRVIVITTTRQSGTAP